MTTDFSVKMGEIGQLTFVRALALLNGVEYRNSDFTSSSAVIWLHCVKIW